MNKKCRKWGWTLAGVIALGAQGVHAQRGGGPVGGEVGNTDDSSEFGNPCSSETARNEIIEKIFSFKKENAPLVLDRKAKEKLLLDLDRIIAGKKPEISDEEKAELKGDAKLGYCYSTAIEKAGVGPYHENFSEKKEEFEKIYEDLKKKVARGDLSAEAQTEIEEIYKNSIEFTENRLDAVREAQQDPEVLKSARSLRKKLAASNTLRQTEIRDLGKVLATSGNPFVGSTFMSWDYDTEKDPKTGEEFFVAYQALYTGTSCMGYGHAGRVTAMPSFKIPLKHFDRNKIGAWVDTAFIPGYGSWHMDSIPLKLASLGELCPAKVTGVVKEGATKPASSATKHER